MSDQTLIHVDEAKMYQELFELLSKNTEEYDHLIGFIKNEILPLLPAHDHFLDIGAGRGNVTKPLAEHFRQITIVEPNPHFYEEVMAWADHDFPHIAGHNGTWHEVELDASADLVMISHVLYYVPITQHEEFISKAYHHLSSKGRMILALNGMESDIWKLARLLYSPQDFTELPYAEKLHQNLQAWGFHSTYYPFSSCIETQTLDQMRFLIDFLLLGRVHFDTAKNTLRDYYIREHLHHDQHYAIRSSGGIMVVTKP